MTQGATSVVPCVIGGQSCGRQESTPVLKEDQEAGEGFQECDELLVRGDELSFQERAHRGGEKL